MFISQAELVEIEGRYGAPDETCRTYELTPAEFDIVRRSQKDGRAHDVTLFIAREQKIVVIRKPMYPPGAYRAPSGGVHRGEPFEEGALREGREETGLEIQLRKYILRVFVRFTCRAEVIDWTTHVFYADALAGRVEPIDTREIAEARLATIDELMGGIRNALLASGSAGLRYRAELGDLVLEKLIGMGLMSR
jgi:ADP-ribose pyrophosphatase YjhB (NUDIX family)